MWSRPFSTRSKAVWRHIEGEATGNPRVVDRWQENTFGETGAGAKKQLRFRKNRESPFDFVKNSFQAKDKLKRVYAKPEESLLGKRGAFWNYDDNGLGNECLREIMHYTKHFSRADEQLQFGATAEYLRSEATRNAREASARTTGQKSGSGPPRVEEPEAAVLDL